MYMSNNVYRHYMCDHLGLYILLVNKFIDLITSSWLTLLIIYINI